MTGIFINVLTLSVSITPIIVVLLILSPFFNKTYKAVWQYWLWLAVTLRLIFPFSFGEGAPVFLKLPLSEIFTASNGGTGEGVLLGENFVNAAESQVAGTSPGLLQLIALVYFAGVILFLAHRIIGYALFRRRLRKWCRKPGSHIQDLVVHIGQAYGIDVKKQGIRILICRKIPGPMVLGFIKPILLLPTEAYDDRRLKLILAHELVHIKRRDLLYKWLLLLASSLHWFNPAVHFMVKKVSQVLEVSCDAKVLQGADKDQRKIYSHMIIELASEQVNYRMPMLFNTFGGGKQNLEMRIDSIFSTAMKGRGVVSLAALIIATLVLGGAVQISAPVEAHGGMGRPESYEDTASLNREPVWQSFTAQEINQSTESAEVVIVDLNQLKKNQEREVSTPQTQ